MGILYETTLTSFLVTTCLLGGGAAWMSGRALARGWRPVLQLIGYMLMLGLALRFFHFALNEGTLLSPHYYVVDTIVLIAAAVLGYRVTRTSQMTTQYRWLYERTSPLTWRARPGGDQQGTT
jgi:hypothetical protein